MAESEGSLCYSQKRSPPELTFDGTCFIILDGRNWPFAARRLLGLAPTGAGRPRAYWSQSGDAGIGNWCDCAWSRRPLASNAVSKASEARGGQTVRKASIAAPRPGSSPLASGFGRLEHIALLALKSRQAAQSSS
jgi:hypothetical protein